MPEEDQELPGYNGQTLRVVPHHGERVPWSVRHCYIIRAKIYVSSEDGSAAVSHSWILLLPRNPAGIKHRVYIGTVHQSPLYVTWRCLCSAASRRVCGPRAEGVQLWAAQRPYPAPVGRISCNKGTELSLGQNWDTCALQTMCPTNADISFLLFLVVYKQCLASRPLWWVCYSSKKKKIH